MGIHEDAYQQLLSECGEQVCLVAVSKTKPVADIKALYDLGHRDFGENYVQELVEKEAVLPKDIRWHFIGHLQTNKVKFIAPFIHLVHGVDSFKLLREIHKQGEKNQRVISCLLQVHIAQEETKFGLDQAELEDILISRATELTGLNHVRVEGLMGMASFTEDMTIVRNEFHMLKSIFDNINQRQTINHKLQTLSMGMSSDYPVAIEEGSNMIRVGSLIFGEREQKAAQ